MLGSTSRVTFLPFRTSEVGMLILHGKARAGRYLLSGRDASGEVCAKDETDALHDPAKV